VLVDTTKIKVAENTSIKVEVKKDAKVEAFKKDIDKKANYAIYFWWLLIILLVMLFFYIHNKINKSLI
jgi:ATP-dependent Zn protease